MNSSITIARPSPAEHAPYAITYVDATARALRTQGNDDLVALLASQIPVLRELLAHTTDAAAQQTYAPGKWTLAESLLHVADTERVFSYRLLTIARGDQTPLPGFDQDAWVPNSRAAARSLSDLLAEVHAVRNATLALVQSLDAAAIASLGTSSGVPVSVRALTWLIAGHFAHHLDITRDRYLAPSAMS